MLVAVATGVRQLLALLLSPRGRRRLRHRLGRQIWRLVWQLAIVYRRTLLRRTRVVAVVGSLGKTTTARAIGAVLCREPAWQRGNARNAIARHVLRIRRGERHAVIEIGVNGPGQMARPARLLGPDVVVVTSIGSEHNRSFGTLAATRAEKLEMVRALRPRRVAILNGDDPNVRWMAGQTSARVITFGFAPENDVRGSELEVDWPGGTRFKLAAGGEPRNVRTQLLGWPMVYSALAAVAVAISEGIPLDEALARLEGLPPTPGRLEPVALENGAFVLRDDFKSTLESMHAALDVLSEIPARRRIVVLGDVSEPPGSQGPIYWRLGARIAEIADRAVLVGDGFQRYAAGARRAGFPPGALVNAKRDVLGVAEIVLADLGEGDVVLVKGRDSQKLDRVSLMLAGRRVRCARTHCGIRMPRCSACPMLEQG